MWHKSPLAMRVIYTFTCTACGVMRHVESDVAVDEELKRPMLPLTWFQYGAGNFCEKHRAMFQKIARLVKKEMTARR